MRALPLLPFAFSVLLASYPPTDFPRSSQSQDHASAESQKPRVCFHAAEWPEANRLFHQDPRWVGGDSASTVDLGNGRILWLFADSWIDPSGMRDRRKGRLVSNSLAIQTDTDPTRATMKFYWGKDRLGGPAAFFPDRGKERWWLGNGIRVGQRLVLFFNRIRNVSTGLGFASVGWAAVMIANPDAEPSGWRFDTIALRNNSLGVLIGFAAVWPNGEYVYAFGAAESVKSHPIYVVRWRKERIERGDLSKTEWWAGERYGWRTESRRSPRAPIFDDGQPELSLHYDQPTGTFFSFQTLGFGPAEIAFRSSPSLTGPWTKASVIHRPSIYDRPQVSIYAAKAHTQLTGADLVVTYATNTFEFDEHFTDGEIYYPRFVRLVRCMD